MGIWLARLLVLLGGLQVFGHNTAIALGEIEPTALTFLPGPIWWAFSFGSLPLTAWALWSTFHLKKHSAHANGLMGSDGEPRGR